jgi:ABC transporter fused permease/ATP-binding protein
MSALSAPNPERGAARARADSLRRVLSLARPELPKLALGTFFLAISSGASLLFPQAIRYIVDGAVGQGKSLEKLDQAAFFLVGVAAVQAAASALRYVLFTICGERVVTRLRTDLFARLMEQDIAFFDERRTGELTSRLASDTTVLQNAVSVNISMALRFAVSVVGGFAFLVFTSWRLALVMLAIVPPVALGAVAYGRRVRRLSRDVQDSLARGSEVAEEALAGIRTVRAFAAEPHEVGRYAGAVHESFTLAKKRSIMAATFMGVASFAAAGAAGAVLWYGGRLVTDGSLTIGKLTSFLVYTLIVALALGGLSDLWADLMKASGAAERIFELLDRAPRIHTPHGEELPEVKGHVVLSNVAFAYPARLDAPVLREVDLAISPGEVVAIVGPSGAGKSTLAALLLRLYDPDEGRILLDGHDLRELRPAFVRRTIGIVSQEPLLFSTSIAENIRYGRPGATDAEIEAAARTANAHGFIEKFPDRYATLVGERGVQLSGGQKQRVAIARAVLKDPRILILDEATSALDAESEHLVKEALERLMVGRTTLIIAHRLSTVAGSDRVCVIDGGRIVQSGAHATLMGEDGLYRRLVERQFVTA